MSAKMLSTGMIHVPKALRTLAVSLVFFLAALPADAQQQDQYRIVWIGHPVVIIVGLILVLLAGIGAAGIFVWLVRWATHGYPFYEQGVRRGRAALDILEERLARGEIDKNEYEEKRKLIGR
jgi:putative membrane protein